MKKTTETEPSVLLDLRYRDSSGGSSGGSSGRSSRSDVGSPRERQAFHAYQGWVTSVAGAGPSTVLPPITNDDAFNVECTDKTVEHQGKYEVKTTCIVTSWARIDKEKKSYSCEVSWVASEPLSRDELKLGGNKYSDG